ncbi:MAG: hypothetical protein MI919_33845, partial [Holophagales bacterium]|nr:hypothetical protein [Holophagales bacterium]
AESDAEAAKEDPLDVLLAGAEALFQLGHHEQASSQARTILSMNAGHAGARELLERIEAAPAAPAVPEETIDMAEARPAAAAPADVSPVPPEMLAEARELMEGGQLVRADQRLRELEEEHGADPEVEALRQSLDQRFHGQLQEKIRELLDEAHGLVDSGEYPAALDRVRQAQELAPTEGEVRELLTRGVQELRGKIETRERSRAIDQVEQQVLLLLRERRLEEARTELEEVEANLGEDDVFTSLGRILERAIQERQNELVAEAGLALEEERFETAVRLLEDVLRLEPENRWVNKRLHEIRVRLDERQQQEEEQQRLEEERRSELEAVHALMEKGELDLATARAQALEASWEREAVADLFEQLGEARRARARLLLGEAEKAKEAADLFKARLLVAEANDLDPDSTAVGRFAELLDATVREHVHGDPLPIGEGSGLLHTVAEIERLRVEGQPLQAWKAVQQALLHFGESETLLELRQDLAEQILDEA